MGRLVALKRPKAAHIFAKDANGHYVEPAWCSARLFAVERFDSIVYDPAAGWGTIINSAAAAGYKAIGADITGRYGYAKRDFLKDNLPKVLTRNRFSIVCNPHFDYIEEFCRRALDLGAGRVAMICPLRRLPAAHWLEDLPLKRVYFLTPRPSMPPASWIAAGNKPGGGQGDFCWLVFDPRHRGAPRFAWLHRDV